jgi:hypothetical protein
MRRPALLPLLVLLLALAAAAQDTTTLDGEPAIRFMAGHGHLKDYCEGQLWITPTRLRFDGFFGPDHSFDGRRAEVKEFHAGHLFGFDYMKVDVGGRTFRLGLYPNLESDFGDRFALAERAWTNFQATYDEVKAAESKRTAQASGVQASVTKDGPTLTVPVLVGPGLLWFRGEKRVTVWSDEKAGGEAYGWIMGNAVPGKLEITADRVRFTPSESSNLGVVFDAPRSEIKFDQGAGGYPRLIMSVRSVGRVSVVAGTKTDEDLLWKGKPSGKKIIYRDVAPIVRALGPDFNTMAAELLPKPAIVVATSPGAQVSVDGQGRGVTGPDGTLRIAELAPGTHQVGVALTGYDAWQGPVVVDMGDERRVDVPLVATTSAAPATPAGPAPFAVKDIVTMLQGGVSSHRVAALVQERGVDFPLDDASEKQIRAAGGDAELLVVIAKTKR